MFGVESTHNSPIEDRSLPVTAAETTIKHREDRSVSVSVFSGAQYEFSQRRLPYLLLFLSVCLVLLVIPVSLTNGPSLAGQGGTQPDWSK